MTNWWDDLAKSARDILNSANGGALSIQAQIQSSLAKPNTDAIIKSVQDSINQSYLPFLDAINKIKAGGVKG